MAGGLCDVVSLLPPPSFYVPPRPLSSAPFSFNPFTSITTLSFDPQPNATVNTSQIVHPPAASPAHSPCTSSPAVNLPAV